MNGARRRPWRPALAGIVVVVAMVAGCGLPDDSRPRVITAEEAPFDLSGQAAAPAQPGPGTVEVLLWFLDSDRLRAVERTVEALDVTTLIEALLQGVAETDPRSVSSAIPPETELRGVTIEASTAVIDLGPANAGLFAIGAGEQRLAFAQIVLTALEVPGITGVQFRVEGEPRAVTVDGGATKPGPLTADDYSSLLP